MAASSKHMGESEAETKKEGERNVPSLSDFPATPWGKRGMELGTAWVATNVYTVQRFHSIKVRNCSAEVSKQD